MIDKTRPRKGKRADFDKTLDKYLAATTPGPTVDVPPNQKIVHMWYDNANKTYGWATHQVPIITMLVLDDPRKSIATATKHGPDINLCIKYSQILHMPRMPNTASVDVGHVCVSAFSNSRAICVTFEEKIIANRNIISGRRLVYDIWPLEDGSWTWGTYTNSLLLRWSPAFISKQTAFEDCVNVSMDSFNSSIPVKVIITGSAVGDGEEIPDTVTIWEEGPVMRWCYVANNIPNNVHVGYVDLVAAAFAAKNRFPKSTLECSDNNPLSRLLTQQVPS